MIYLGDKEVGVVVDSIDLSQTTATADDVLEGKEFFNASGEKVAGTYKDMLQARVDVNNSCQYLFYSYGGDNIDFAKNLDTSKVTNMAHMFYSSQYLTTLDISWDTSNVTNMGSMFYSCKQLTSLDLSELNFSKLNSAYMMFRYCDKLESVSLPDISNVTDIGFMFQGCKALKSVTGISTPNITGFSRTFEDCYALETVETIDLINAIYSVGYIPITLPFANCRKLTNLTLKNIRYTIQIGSGTSYGHLLTLDSLLNTIKELWTNTGTSTLTLTMGTANTAKLADVYVKLIDITDEMRAEDEYIDNKAPFVQCESTDEGAMLITEYVTTVKNWQLA